MKKHTPVTLEVDENLMRRVYTVLGTAEDNALEIYNDHMNRLEKHPMTSRNKYVAECLQKDTAEVRSIIGELNELFRF